MNGIFSCARGTKRSALLTLIVATLALGPNAVEAQVAGRTEAVVYGEDDRMDVYAHPDAGLRQLATDSIVALMSADDVSQELDGSWSLSPDVEDLETAFELCSTERFLDQPTAAFCSGTLVAPDVILTAGHCIETQSDCEDTLFVFDYLYTSEGALAVLEDDDVYGCADLVAQGLGNRIDYAYIRLDRPVVGHTPATIARDGLEAPTRITSGEAVSVLGFGSGLPLKIDNGGTVYRDTTRGGNFFETSTDTFGGNSGSGVFNASGELVGVLSSGLDDYERTIDGCVRVVELPESDGGEAIGHVDATLARYCGRAGADENLCVGVDPIHACSVSRGSQSPRSERAMIALFCALLGLGIFRRRRSILAGGPQ